MLNHNSKRFFCLLLLFAQLSGLVAPLAQATVSATTVRFSYSGNGTTTAFSFPHLFHANTDITVIVRTNSSGAEVTKTLTTHYTVTGAGVSAGGTVTFLTAPVTGETVSLLLVPPSTQTLDLSNVGPLNAESIETQLDKLTNQVQRLQNQASRSVHLSEGWASAFSMVLPVNLPANGIIGVNSTANGLQVSTLAASVADLAALTGGADTTLHFHASDRARINHTGTQLRVTISDFLPITSGDIADGTIVAADLSATAAIAGSQLAAAAAITSGQILDGTLVSADLSSSAGITSAQILDGTLVSADLSASAGITSAQILDGTLVSADLSASAGITSAQILDGTLVSADLSASAGITSAQILDGTLTTADLNAAAGITGAQIANGTLTFANHTSQAAGTIVGRGSDQGTGAPQVLTLGAGLTSAGGVLAAAGGAATITVQSGSVTLGSGSFNTLNFATGTGGFTLAETPANAATVVISSNAITTALILDGTIVNADLSASAAVALTKLQNATANSRVLASGASGSGSSYVEATLASTLSFAANVLGVASESIGTGQVTDGSLTSADLSSSAGITSAQILDGTIVNADLSASAAITGGKISTVPDTVTNVTAATNMTLSPTGNLVSIPANKSITRTGQAGSPTGFSVGGDSYDTTLKAAIDKNDIGVLTRSGTYSVQPADSTAIANTTSETTFDQLPTSFPANTLTANTVITWDATYLYSDTGAPTYRLRYQLVGTSTFTVVDTGVGIAMPSGVSNRAIHVHGTLTILTIGASGTYRCDIVLANDNSNSLTVTGPTSAYGSPSATIDTTQANQLRDLFTWSAASSSNTIKRQALHVRAN